MSATLCKTDLAERVQKLIRASKAPVPRREALDDSVPDSLAALSALSSTPDTVAPPAPVPDRSSGSKRVLIAEADPLHRQVLTRLVEASGYAAESATNANEVIAAFQPERFGLIFLDCDSPEISGLATAAGLRQRENGGPRTPIVAITGASDQSHRKRRKAAGIDNYLAKPILRENVESVLTRYAPSKTDQSRRYMALDRHRLEELDQLAGDRPELFCEWIGIFLASAPELVDRLRTAHEDGNIAALEQAAAQLRARSGQLGALRLQEICGIVAALSESGSMAGIESLLPEVAVAVDRAARELGSLERDLRSGVRLAKGSAGSSLEKSSADRDILLVEADPLVARFLVTSLESAGFRVTHVLSGRAALDEARMKNFGAAVVNLMVPEVDGYGVLSEVRAAPGDTMPVLILSARRQEQDVLRAFELGADDYVTIPFNPTEVVARVRRLVKQGAHVA